MSRIKIFQNLDCMILIICIFGNEDIIYCPFNPSFLLSIFVGCKFGIYFTRFSFITLNFYLVIQICKSLIHYCHWFILWFFIEISANYYWHIRILILKIIFNKVTLLNSSIHICWFGFKMTITNYKSKILVIFELKYAIHQKLTLCGRKFFNLLIGTDKLILLIKYSWSTHLIFLFLILIFIA